jgi:choline/glycine/proline betaine transport protein
MSDDKLEFSNFSWFSMMFGAGIGIGILTFATAEPMYHLASNPSTIMDDTVVSSAENVRSAYVWSFTHWGLAA